MINYVVLINNCHVFIHPIVWKSKDQPFVIQHVQIAVLLPTDPILQPYATQKVKPAIDLAVE